MTKDEITDDQIRQLRRLDLCAVCNCGLLHVEHHNDLMDGHHAFDRVPREQFDSALTACGMCRGSGRYPGRALCCNDCSGEGYQHEARINRERCAVSWNMWNGRGERH